MNVHFDGVSYDGLVYLDEKQAAQLDGATVKTGDVLLNITGASIGRVSIAPEEIDGARVNQHVSIIRLLREIDPRFISTFLSSPDMQGIITSENYGATRQALTKTIIERFVVSLPPAAEQRRIVAKIDRLSARSKRARDELDKTARMVALFKKVMLDAAFDGKLIASDQCNRPANWPIVDAGSLIREIHAGKNLRCEERPPLLDEKGVVKVSAVTWGIFDAKQSKTLPAEYTPAERDKISSGDFLFSRANTLELVGACVIVGNAPNNLYLSDKILRLEIDEDKKPWLLWYLRSSEGRKQLEHLSSGNQLSMRNISQAGLRSLRVPFPSRVDRNEIVRRIEHAFAAIDRLAAEAQSARKLLDKLDQAILAKAFRGELVPQDPSDEPASVLLERIRAERAVAPGKLRRRRSAEA